MKVRTVPACDSDRHQQFVSDVFHAISQPLTALRCSLDLALLKGGDADTYRVFIGEALGYAQQISACAEFLRELAAADDPGVPSPTDLCSVIEAAVNELRPVFESSGVSVRLVGDGSIEVFADPARLHKATFLALDYGAAEYRVVQLRTLTPAMLEIRYELAVGDLPYTVRLRSKQSLELAQRTFTATGANVDLLPLPQGEVMRMTWHESREQFFAND